MDEKISLEAIAAYADAYADKVSKEFFSSKPVITGPEILKLTNVQQVNMFVLRELLLAWKAEAAKIRSPYFDYENAEVKEALDNLMAVLSNHIAVRKEDFGPLLKNAVRQTLLVIFNPYDFFSILVTGNNNRVELSQFKQEIKYLKINQGPIVRLVQKLEEKGLSEVSGNEAFAILDQILEEVSFTPEDLEEHIGRFSATLPLDPSKFFPVVEPEPPASPPPAEHLPRPAEKLPKIEKRYVVDEDDDEDQTTPGRPTLNDRIQQEKRPAVNSNFQKIRNIKDHLTINQKFMFTKVLFYGDFESFSRTVDELDQLPDMDAALQYLEQQSANWDRDSREFHEFMEMVEKRFA